MNIMSILPQILKNPQLQQNPMTANALKMLQNNDEQGLKQLAMNLCKEKGVTPEEVLKQIQS